MQRKDAFDRSATVSVSVQNIGGKFFHPIGRVSRITTNSSSSPFGGKKNQLRRICRAYANVVETVTDVLL